MALFKMPSRTLCALALIIVASGLGGCAVGLADSSQGELRPDQSLLCEPGGVEAERAIIYGPAGLDLGKGVTLETGGLYLDTPEAEMVSGMTRAASTALASSGIQGSSTGRVGTAYMVRLQCGGVVYAFEDGPQRFAAGSWVAVQHGLIPTLLPR